MLQSRTVRAAQKLLEQTRWMPVIHRVPVAPFHRDDAKPGEGHHYACRITRFDAD